MGTDPTRPTPPPAPALPPPEALAPVAAPSETLVVPGGWQIEGLPATVRRALRSIAVTVPADAGAALWAARPSDSPAWSDRWCPLVTSPASLPSRARHPEGRNAAVDGEAVDTSGA